MGHPSTFPSQSSFGAAHAGQTRVLIVDDSITARIVLSRVVDEDDRLRVEGRANGAREALSMLDEITVDVILLDLEMPGVSGLEALPLLIEKSNNANILVVSSIAVEGAEPTLKALALGAADTIAKPGSGVFDKAYRTDLADRIYALGKGGGKDKSAEANAQLHPAGTTQTINPKVLAIGASTGGIHALDLLLKKMPRRIGIPILITQHLPDHFVPIFARQIERSSGRNVDVGANGLGLKPDHIIIAPGDAHLQVEGTMADARIRLDRSPASSGCKPSVDPMFASLARVFGDKTLGVVLSGMGNDGAEGAPAIVNAGGQIWVQDAESSAVWGMPRAIVDAGLASVIMAPEDLAEHIATQMKLIRCR